ncbi:major facilitator superfamily-domain-containing protein [Powellomyces hirtus]|nr:major facilitator superfamily-domain-containing protein [Powellomyces hirtus]
MDPLAAPPPTSRLDKVRTKLRPLLLPTFCLAQMLDALNLSGANVALPEIARDLGFDTSNLQWVISAYALTFGGFLLLTGRLGDIYGHRNFFVAGLVWFTVFAVLAGLAQSVTWMIVARGLQGVGAASTIPNAIALILQVYPIGRSRNNAMAVFASTGAVGFCLGLILGGSLTSSSLGWRWIFHISAIVSASMAIISILKFSTKSTTPPPRQTVDYLGAALSTASMLLLVFVLTDAHSRGWGSPMVISLLIVSLFLLALFVVVELKIKQPLMPMSIWKLPNFAPAFVIAACLVGFFQGYLYFITLIFQEVFNYGALESALRYLPLGIVAAIMGIMSEKIIHKLNIKVALILGLALGTIGNVILGFYNHENQYWSIVFPSFIVGVTGLSSVYASVSIAAISAAPADQAGIVGGLLNTAFQIGGGLGLAITTAVSTTFNSPTDKGEDLLQGYHAGLWTATAMVGLALVIAIFFIKNVDMSSKQETEVMQEVLVVTAAGTVQGFDDHLEPAKSHATLHEEI